MRFVLAEYLSSLKEDGELDSFLTELLKNMRRIPLSKIQRGRQYGVDIPAVGTDDDGTRKLFLYVIKQGNFSRKNWDGGNVNDIRPSINDILDAYIPSKIPKPYDLLPIKIIVCCNGDMESAVQLSWTGFVNQQTKTRLEFDFWGINSLVDLAEQYQMQEESISSQLMSNFRRALSFIDLQDYNLAHFYKFLNDLLPSKEAVPLSDKKIIKRLRLVNLCLSIVHSLCKKSNNVKPAYFASERVALIAFNWITENEFIDRKGVWHEYYTILQNWRHLNAEYIRRTVDHLTDNEGLCVGIGNHDEYCLVTYEQIGIVAMMGMLELWECTLALIQPEERGMQNAQNSFKNVEGYAYLIVQLIENNPSSLNPRYDEHCIEINMVLALLFEMGYFDSAIRWLRGIISQTILNVKIAKFFPLFYSDVSKLYEEEASDQKSSLLYYILAEWCLVLRQIDYYHLLRDFLNKDMPQLNLQLWIPDKETDNYLYTEDASRKSGSTIISIDLPKNHLLLEMHMAEERVLMNDERGFRYVRYFANFAHFLSSRHHRMYPFPNSWREYLSTPFCFNAPETETCVT